MTCRFFLALIRLRFDFRRDNRKFRERTGSCRGGERERSTSVFDWTVDRRRFGGQSSAILIFRSQVPIASAFLAKPSLTVNPLQCAATESSVRKEAGAGVKRCQTLIEFDVAGCCRKRGRQWSQCFLRHVVRNEELGIS